MMLQRRDAGGGDDAGLAQRAAHTLLPGPGFEDQFPAAGEERAEWTSEPLAGVEPEGTEGFGEIPGGQAGRDDGVGDARAVQIGRESGKARVWHEVEMPGVAESRKTNKDK